MPKNPMSMQQQQKWLGTSKPALKEKIVTPEQFFGGIVGALGDPKVAPTEPFYCLNLYKFHNPPQYPDDWKGVRHATGKEAHAYYIKKTQEACIKCGASYEILLYAYPAPGMPVWEQVGDYDQGYDAIIMVRYNSKTDLDKLVASKDYLATAPIRGFAVDQNWQSFTPASPAKELMVEFGGLHLGSAKASAFSELVPAPTYGDAAAGSEPFIIMARVTTK